MVAVSALSLGRLSGERQPARHNACAELQVANDGRKHRFLKDTGLLEFNRNGGEISRGEHECPAWTGAGDP